ncbi:hypothetical protein [Ornithinimicrobium kibberense]|uniref:hypothetical protein n=1 Tax=Ornithinimicrobium kibberense TaxID=282060 RepID=UPI00360E3117
MSVGSTTTLPARTASAARSRACCRVRGSVQSSSRSCTGGPTGIGVSSGGVGAGADVPTGSPGRRHPVSHRHPGRGALRHVPVSPRVARVPPLLNSGGRRPGRTPRPGHRRRVRIMRGSGLIWTIVGILLIIALLIWIF